MNNISLSALATALSLCCSLSAHAGPAADEAKQHFAAVGAGDIALLMRGYAEHASLNWVGGPLDGTYSDTAAIRGTWEKFAKSGEFKVSVDKLEESTNPKGSTVTANVKFEGKMAVKVRYVLVYRDGRIVSETWQVDPNLAVGGAAAY